MLSIKRGHFRHRLHRLSTWRGGNDWTATIPASFVFPVGGNRPPRSPHTRTQPHSLAVSLGNHASTHPRGMGNREGAKPEEAKGPWRWPRESQADAGCGDPGRRPLPSGSKRRDTQSARDAVTRPAPIHSHTSGRARARSRGAPTTLVRGGRWQGLWGRREQRFKASDKEQSPADLERPGHGVQRQRDRAFVPSRGAASAPLQVLQRFLPQGHTQAHSSLERT